MNPRRAPSTPVTFPLYARVCSARSVLWQKPKSRLYEMRALFFCIFAHFCVCVCDTSTCATAAAETDSPPDQSHRLWQGLPSMCAQVIRFSHIWYGVILSCAVLCFQCDCTESALHSTCFYSEVIDMHMWRTCTRSHVNCELGNFVIVNWCDLYWRFCGPHMQKCVTMRLIVLWLRMKL